MLIKGPASAYQGTAGAGGELIITQVLQGVVEGFHGGSDAELVHFVLGSKSAWHLSPKDGPQGPTARGKGNFQGEVL